MVSSDIFVSKKCFSFFFPPSPICVHSYIVTIPWGLNVLLISSASPVGFMRMTSAKLNQVSDYSMQIPWPYAELCLVEISTY